MADLAPHQLEAIRKIHNGCVLRGGVGSGKTRVALVYFYTHIADGRLKVNGAGGWKAPKNPTDLYVITTAKKRDDLDWEKEAAILGLGVSTNITIDSWNNIGKYEDVHDAFFVFDEQRLVGSGAWVNSFHKIARANGWILLTATPGDNWMDYVPIFVANGHYKNRAEFTRRHVVYKPFRNFPQVDRYVDTAHLESLRASVLVEMPHEKTTRRHVQHVQVMFDRDDYLTVTKKRWDIFNDRPLKDVSQMFVAMRKVVNHDVSRLGAVLELVEKHPRLIIFYNFDYELELLRTLKAIGFTVAEWNGHRHEPVPDGESWVYLVQYTAGAEGWNCTRTDAMVFWSLNYSYKINEQAKGRIDRINTKYTDLYYYILLSDSPIDSGIVRALGSKKDFNEKEFVA